MMWTDVSRSWAMFLTPCPRVHAPANLLRLLLHQANFNTHGPLRHTSSTIISIIFLVFDCFSVCIKTPRLFNVQCLAIPLLLLLQRRRFHRDGEEKQNTSSFFLSLSVCQTLVYGALIIYPRFPLAIRFLTRQSGTIPFRSTDTTSIRGLACSLH